MPYFLGGLLLLLLLVGLANAFVNANPARIGRFLRWFLLSLGVAAGVAVLAFLVLSDRLGPALGIVTILAPLLLRARHFWRRLGGVAGPAPGQTSEVETDFLHMRLDHDTGAMSGTVRRGAQAGRRLDELGEAELIALWRDCRVADEASARLMEAYLDRLDPAWRERAAEAPGTAAATDAMTAEEAYAVLGLAPGAGVREIKEAHHKLMMKLHPDQGGSTYLAAKINRAREVLLHG